MRYECQQHGGKHAAINFGARLARGELFLIFDSDDTCAPHALECFLKHWNALTPQQRVNVAGVTALCADENGQVVGQKFPNDTLLGTPQELAFRWKVGGEKWGCLRTDVLRRFPFPIVAGAKYIDENIVWFRIGAQFQTLYVNEILRTYHKGEDQIIHTYGGDHAGTIAMINANLLNTSLQFFRRAPLRFLRAALNFSRFSLHLGASFFTQRRTLNNRVGRILWLTAYTFGALLFWRDKARNRVH